MSYEAISGRSSGRRAGAGRVQRCTGHAWRRRPRPARPARHGCPRRPTANISRARATASPATRRAAASRSRAGSRCPRRSARSTRRTSRPIRRPASASGAPTTSGTRVARRQVEDGSLLYPAFPYPSYTKITRADSDAIYGYIQTMTPVKQEEHAAQDELPVQPAQPAHGLACAVLHAGRVQAKTRSRSAEWNRGAYLVQGLGHCDACHTSRNLLGATVEGQGVCRRPHSAAGLVRAVAHVQPRSRPRPVGDGARSYRCCAPAFRSAAWCSARWRRSCTIACST